MSLDRLISLAKRTGDRLIIHDPVHGRDIVMMDIDAYEHLLFGGQVSDTRLHDGDEYAPGNEALSFDDEETPSGEDVDWHSAGSVLTDRYGEWGDAEQEKSGVSLVEDMWNDGQEAMQDAREERQTTEEGLADNTLEEPVFYEEPVV